MGSGSTSQPKKKEQQLKTAVAPPSEPKPAPPSENQGSQNLEIPEQVELAQNS